MALFSNFGVNRRNCLCGVQEYASAQFLDFLELAENCSFLDRKLISALNETVDEHESKIHTERFNLKKIFSSVSYAGIFSPQPPEILRTASHKNPVSIRIRGPLPGAIFSFDENLRSFDLNKSPINRLFLSL
jgi:hypothetical protein